MLHIDDSVGALGPTAPDDIAEPQVPVNKSSAVQLGSGCAAGLRQTDEVLQAASKLVRIRQLRNNEKPALFTQAAFCVLYADCGGKYREKLPESECVAI